MFFTFLYEFVDKLLTILIFAIIGRALLSWFRIEQGSPFFLLSVILHQITEPILGPMRRIIPTVGMIDISPIVAILLLQLLHTSLLEAIRVAVRGA
jgi:YggT family protein